MVKVHPPFDWTIQPNQRLYPHKQHSLQPAPRQGFVSIGCAPCTRAVREGESFRSGRWWWEDQSKKERAAYRWNNSLRQP